MTSELPHLDERTLPPGSRGIRLGATPTRTVVVASHAPREALERCLATVLPACRAAGVEVVVCRSCDPPELEAIGAAHPSVVLMPAPDGVGARGLRAIGFTAADGDIVTIVEDDRPLPADWADALTAGAADARG